MGLKQATFTVRLIYSHGSNEVRYQDETLVLAPVGADPRITSIVDQPLRVLGKGPTVNSVQPTSSGVVIVFDSDIDTGTLTGAYTIAGRSGPVGQVTESYSQRELTLSFSMTPGSRYHLSLTSAVKDIAGQSLQGGYDYDFAALTPPTG